MPLAEIDWTNVLDTAVITIPAIIAAIYAARVHREVRTPSGKSLGEVAERAHETGVANNLLLAASNGETIPATQDQLDSQSETSPQVPK